MPEKYKHSKKLLSFPHCDHCAGVCIYAEKRNTGFFWSQESKKITLYTYSSFVLQDANGSSLSLKRVTTSQEAVGGWRATPVLAQPAPIDPHAVGAAFPAGM